ncbi:MAG: anti-sigma factor antagonist [Bacteroidetes bacterium]|nr:MAG: anti-sigma factor antagonist [Bacteroidota bacterium]
MEIKVTEVNDIIVISLEGKLDSTTAPEAEAGINKYIEQKVPKMVVSLKETSYVSSAGLRVFLATAKKMTAAGCSVKFCCPNDIVKEILDISGFSLILDVKETEEEAVNNV